MSASPSSRRLSRRSILKTVSTGAAGPAALCNFDYAGPLSEAVLLGNAAYRTGKRIGWDAAKLEVTNNPRPRSSSARRTEPAGRWR